MSTQRVTQEDVARAAGVHRTTVSLSLKNHQSIPPATSKRIKQIAKELGYVPDPMLSALTAYRNAVRPPAFQGSLAWVGNDKDGFHWREVPIFLKCFESAKVAAQSRGFNLEEFELNASGIPAKRTASILRARNIQGLVFGPQPRAASITDFPWPQFSAITIGYSLVNPRLHTVISTQYRSIISTVQEMKKRGYKRIGLVLSSNQDEKTDHNYLAGFLVEHYGPSGVKLIPPLWSDEDWPTSEAFAKWYDRYKPDGIVTGNPQLLKLTKQCGLKVPEDVGVACIAVVSLGDAMAGICENFTEVGRVAVDYLASMIMRGEKGVPTVPLRIAVEGQWNEGATLKSA